MSEGAATPIRLIVLFTYGMSLESWRRQGLIDRELSYYRHLLEAGVDDVALFTYGPSDTLQPNDGPFRLARRPSWLGHLVYSLVGPLLRRRAFAPATIVKSNQSRGAWTGVVEKWLHPRRRLVVRCGWVRTREMLTVEEKLSGWRLRWAEWVERVTFKAADAIFVTSPTDRDYVISTYGIDPRAIDVMPNAVDTTLFSARPASSREPWPREVAATRRRLRVIAIGRLVEMKNFQGLIQAIGQLRVPAELTLLGDGPYRGALERVAADAGVVVEFRSFVENSRVPDALRDADIFVMPQLYGSGMSKVILEAMACGPIVVASDIQPHRDVIADGLNGFLSGVSPDELAGCLRRVLAITDDERTAVRTRARADVESKYSMRALAAREVRIYRALLAGAYRAQEAAAG